MNEQAAGGEDREQTTIRLPAELKEALQCEAERQGESLSSFIVALLEKAREAGGWQPGERKEHTSRRFRGRDPERVWTKSLDEMDRDELKQYAREKGIQLYTVVPERMRETIRITEESRAHRGDAFRNL